MGEVVMIAAPLSAMICVYCPAQLAVVERLGRLEAIEERWQALRAAKRAFGKEDYEAAGAPVPDWELENPEL